VILLCGIPTETPLALVRAELDELEVPYAILNQRRFAEIDMGFSVSDAGVSGWLRIGRDSFRLEEIRAVYTRIMDDSVLPELRGEAPDSPRRHACRALHETLVRWYEVAPARVVNRSGPMASNGSKPYQAQLISRHGLSVPETLITNDPDLARDFHAVHGRVVYKSISGVRSIVQTLGEADLARLELIRWCPTQFQVYVEGTNVRVHTIGSEVFATAVHTTVTDYRYANGEENVYAELESYELPDELAERCIALSNALMLPFAGIDLKITPEGEPFCFEVNPSPAFSYFESQTRQPIARAVARYLVEA
jgi:RimK-like ATP-grasp domain